MLAALVVLSVACARRGTAAIRVVPPLALAQLALAPADAGDMYKVDSERYLDDDGNTAPAPTTMFIRQLSLVGSPADDAPAEATYILVTVGDRGKDAVTEFIDAADDSAVGPPNLEAYIGQQFPGSKDIRAELDEDFPDVGDQSVANKVTWTQPVDGADQVWSSYAVYIQSGDLLALGALRIAGDDQAALDGLRKQAEVLAKKQADKLKAAPSVASAQATTR